MKCDHLQYKEDAIHTDLSVDGRHGELHVAVRDVSLTVVKAAATKELLAGGRESSITAYN